MLEEDAVVKDDAAEVEREKKEILEVKKMLLEKDVEGSRRVDGRGDGEVKVAVR